MNMALKKLLCFAGVSFFEHMATFHPRGASVGSHNGRQDLVNLFVSHRKSVVGEWHSYCYIKLKAT